MQKEDLNAAARRLLDQRTSNVAFWEMQRPPRGWVKAIRKALGMTTAQLAQRLGVSQPAVVSLERMEALGHIRLDTLQRAASALDCRLIYAFVPNQPLETRVQSRRREVVEQQLAAVERSMSLENQSVEDTEAREQLLAALASQIDSRSLWNDNGQ